MIWLLSAVACVILLAVSVFIRWADQIIERRKTERFTENKVLREILVEWEPIVLTSYKTIRDVKMFANRARIICRRDLNNDNENVVHRLVAFTALVHLGEARQNVTFNDVEQFENCKLQWQNRLSKIFIEAELETNKHQEIPKILQNASMEDWNYFTKLATIIGFPNLKNDIA